MILAKAKPMELGALAEILKAESLRPDHIAILNDLRGVLVFSILLVGFPMLGLF